MTSLRLASFADTFPADMRDKIEKLASDLEQATASQLDTLIDEPSDTGKLRSSRALNSDGKGLRLGWTEVRAIPIDMGRVKSKSYRRKIKGGKKSVPFSRLLGSDRAPTGFTQPAIKSLRLGWEQTVEGAGKDF